MPFLPFGRAIQQAASKYMWSCQYMPVFLDELYAALAPSLFLLFYHGIKTIRFDTRRAE